MGGDGSGGACEGTVGADELNVPQVRLFACHPLAGDGPGVAGAGSEADTADDIGAPGWCLQQRHGSAETAEVCCIISQPQLGSDGIEANQHCIGPQMQGSADAIPALGNVNDGIMIDGILQ